ncbi:outer membrane biogenesis protein BamB [Thalassoglobus neptunius]|uniref:Outer membrane biogenesis protein BamB n=1 Tax=Thalassoglobus neptunius TaxID=1938619 RepID=A0A5C5WYS1_9PLAN|nr:PQQ-binding-like beta-propeller repeat protein [Thalassoglobus neptunius]TWT55847.1 outer membrane biogenesis protein BamB [Thalassoglobus neptunius]
MTLTFSRLFQLVVALSVVPCIARAENWPMWRGPSGDGISREAELPVTWNDSPESSENILWKTPIPGRGYSSPIVWEYHLFLTTCLEESQERALLSVDKKSGEILWQKTVLTSPLESRHKFNSYASATPATDGENVFVAFLKITGETVEARNVGKPREVTAGSVIVVAYDFQGEKVWETSVGEFASVHGFCSCPVIYKETVIINGDHDGESYLAALDRASGEIRWKIPRPNQTRSYVTPIVREFGGREQLIMSGSHCVTSYDPATGEELWRVDGPTEQFVASMVADDRYVFLSAGFPTYHVMAVDPLGTGDVTDSHVLWHETSAKCYVPSPIRVEDYLFVADDHGIANCFDAASGERLWRGRFGRHFSTSLTATDEYVYFLDDDGKTTVVRPADELVVVAENELNEECRASPALSDGRIYIRGLNHLFCIGNN